MKFIRKGVRNSDRDIQNQTATAVQQIYSKSWNENYNSKASVKSRNLKSDGLGMQHTAPAGPLVLISGVDGQNIL